MTTFAAWLAALAALLVACGGSQRTTAYEEQVAPEERCVCAEGCSRACPVDDDAQTTYRKVVRNPDAEPVPDIPADSHEVVDVTAAQPLEPEALQAAVAALDARGAAIAGFRADFVRGRGDEVAVLFDSGELVIYQEDEPFARVQLGTPATVDSIAAVRLVDERAELLVRHTEDGRELLTVCRVIGEAIGRVFEIEPRDRAVEFVHIGEERAIRVREGAAPSTLYRWNRWEGMFRVPGPAPTSPPPR